MKIRLTEHARAKFRVLAEHGCIISAESVRSIVENPDGLMKGYGNRQIAQGPLDSEHVLRVVFEEHADEKVIVTFYPGRTTRYESSI